MRPARQVAAFVGFLRTVLGSTHIHEAPAVPAGGYDLTVGTSEHGEQTPSSSLHLPKFEHLLVVFGGPTGLEPVLASDPYGKQHASPGQLFDRYVYTCFDQGSRTIRTEEAVLISLSFLQPAVAAAAHYVA